jgi:hypothetical protein
MSEVLKMLTDLAVMGEHLQIGVLQHHYKNYDVFESKALSESFESFHMKDLESSDYRSAYHQFQGK